MYLRVTLCKHCPSDFCVYFCFISELDKESDEELDEGPSEADEEVDECHFIVE